MKNQFFKTQASAGEVGTGLGLMLVCMVLLFVAPSTAPSQFISFFIGLMIALGLFSDKKRKNCTKQ